MCVYECESQGGAGLQQGVWRGGADELAPNVLVTPWPPQPPLHPPKARRDSHVHHAQRLPHLHETCGAVGVSGASPDTEEALAEAGMAAMLEPYRPAVAGSEDDAVP